MKQLLQARFLISFLFIQVFIIHTNKALAQVATQRWDDRVMIDLQEHRTPGQTGFFMFLSKNYLYGDVGIPAGLLVGGIVNNDKVMRQNSLYVASSTAISYGFMLLIKHVVKRPRPFIQNIHITPVYIASGTSFPSGHTSSTFATATALSIAYPKWYVIAPAYLWAGSTAYSRMYLGVHYPTDVGAGLILGSGTAVALSFMKH